MNNQELEDWIRGVKKEGVDYLSWAKAAGFENANFIHNFLKKRSKGMNAGLKYDTVQRLRGALEIIKNPDQDNSSMTLRDDVGLTPVNRSVSLPAVPVYGTLPGKSSVFMRKENIVEEIKRPEELDGIRGGFCVYVGDTLMEPRYFRGEKVSVNPNKPPIISQDCVLVMQDGSMLVRRFEGEEHSVIKVMQYNPKEICTYSKTEVSSIFDVVGRPR